MRQKILHFMLPFIVFYMASLSTGILAWYTTFNESDIEWSLVYTTPAMTGIVFIFNPIAWAVFIYTILFIFILRNRQYHARYYNGLLLLIVIATFSSYPLLREALMF